VWWTSDDLLTASVVAFHSPVNAAAFVDAAGSARCRGPARAFGISHPLRGRMVLWTDPALYLEGDLYFAYGREVFRFTDVPIHGAWDKVPRKGGARPYVQTTELLACGLAEARCS
jgi:hypothetical protein